MKITPLQQYIFLGVVAFVVTFCLFYQFALKPINKDIVELQAELDQKKKDLEAAKQMVAKYVEFKKRADSVQRELEWLQNRIPKTIDRTKLLETVSFLQNQSGVFLTTFQFQTSATTASASGDGYVEVPVSIKLNSNYKGLLNFLYQIGISNLFMTVRDLTITSFADISHPNVTLSAQMVVSGIQAK